MVRSAGVVNPVPGVQLMELPLPVAVMLPGGSVQLN
jgi:hypothetical protein